MNPLSDRSLERLVADWLEEDGPRVAPDRLVESVISEVPAARSDWGIGILRASVLGLAAAATILVAVVGIGLLMRGNVGSPPTPDGPSPSPAAACPPDIPACGQHLAADVQYTAARFEPSIRFAFPDDRWKATIDEPERLQLEIESDTRRRIGIYRDPEPLDAAGQPVLGVGTTPDELIAWLTSHPEITAGTPGRTTLFGLEARYIDVRPSETASTENADLCLPTQPEFNCLPILRTGSGTEHSADLGLSVADRYRILLVDRSGTTLAVIVEAHHTSGIDVLLERAAPVLDSLEFAP